MIQVVLTIYGALAAVAGFLMALPDRIEALRPVQIGVNELSLFSMLLGVVAMVGGFVSRPVAWLAILLGGAGTALSIRPFLVYPVVAHDMKSAMKAGLGKDYEAQIPEAVLSRFPYSSWTLENSLGKRERTAHGKLTKRVPYAEVNGRQLALDTYQPTAEPILGNQYPALIVIHGGGWRNGEPGGWFTPHNHYFASQGYVVFDIEYRLSGEAKWPAQFEDVERAIQWVKDHADEYRVDPARIALLGRSAGAHLALMAGYCVEGIRAIVSLYGPAEMRWPGLEAGSAIIDLMGGTFEQLPEAYEQATPLNFVRDNLPPTLIIEGGLDTIVPYHHGDRLSGLLAFTNTPFALLRVPWSRHGFDALLAGTGAQLVYYHLDRFLAWNFYREM
ncbi:MAG: alpha/beta hydrolase [Chloroflexota bacterium]